jgi:PKD repeat protein
MAVYHEAPFTLDGFTEIPADAAPAVGVDEYGNREAVAEASLDWAGDNLLTYEVAVTGLEATFTITTASELEDGYSIDWDFGNGRYEHGDDLVQTVTYAQPGTYLVRATINQPGEPTLSYGGPVTVGDEPEAPPA